MSAEKFAKLAESLDAQAAEKLNNRSADNTPKRAMQAASRRIDAEHLKRGADAARAIAAAIAAGTLDPAAAGVKTKAQVLAAVRTGIDHPSYYRLIDTGVYSDTSPAGKAVQALLEAARDPVAAAERARLARIAELEADIRFRSIPGFFPSPPAVVARLMELAEIEPGHNVLEPSAGKGDIAEAVRAAGVEPVLCEINYDLMSILGAKGFQKLVAGDFIERFSTLDPVDGAGEVTAAMEQFDRVLMNPPFENGQDVDHVRHAYKLLKPGGKLVAVMSAGGFYRQDKKATAFRAWLDDKIDQGEAGAEPLPDGSFVSAFRPTGVNAMVVTIERPPLPSPDRLVGPGDAVPDPSPSDWLADAEARNDVDFAR